MEDRVKNWKKFAEHMEKYIQTISLTDLPILSRNILNRYFGHQTTWYLHCH